MKQSTNQILLGYWNEVRGERLAPRRFEIEPARIATILPETFILERLDSETFPYRLAGTKICDQFGTEFRGTNFLDGWQEADRLTIARHFASTTAKGGAIVLEIAATAGLDGADPVHFEAILLPLVHTSSTVSRIVGSISAIDPPAWLGIKRLAYRRIVSCEALWPDGRPHAVAEGFRNQAPFIASLAGARLVKQDRRAFRVLDGGLSKAAAEDL